MNFLGDATEVGLLRFASERLANLDKVSMILMHVRLLPRTSSWAVL